MLTKFLKKRRSTAPKLFNIERLRRMLEEKFKAPSNTAISPLSSNNPGAASPQQHLPVDCTATPTCSEVAAEESSSCLKTGSAKPKYPQQASKPILNAHSSMNLPSTHTMMPPCNPKVTLDKFFIYDTERTENNVETSNNKYCEESELNLRNSKCLPTEEHTNNNSHHTITLLEEKVCAPQEPLITSIEPQDTLVARRERLNNVATVEVDMPFSAYATACLLPESYRQLSSLYKIIANVHAFNQQRSLSLIFAKYRDSIERLFRRPVEAQMLEQLHFLLAPALLFVPVTVVERGEHLRTFTVKIDGSPDIDQALYSHFIQKYTEWLAAQGITSRVRRLDPTFKAPEVPRKPLFLAERTEAAPAAVVAVAKKKAADILTRIREKERQRREAFVADEGRKVNYKEKVDGLFRVARRRAIPLADVLFSLGGGALARPLILTAIKEQYEIRTINGTEYVVRTTEDS